MPTQNLLAVAAPPSGSRKTFIIDTNILLHSPNALFVFDNNHVVIPLAVIEEIDDQKRRQDEIGRNAREVSRILDGLRVQGSLAEGVALPNGGTLRVEVNNYHQETRPHELECLDLKKADNRILAIALNLEEESSNGPVVLVSKDLNLRVKADVLGLKSEDLANDRVDVGKLYSGQREVVVTRSELGDFYQNRRLDFPHDEDRHPHQFVVLKCNENPSMSGLGRYINGEVLPLQISDAAECFGLRSRNKEQDFALELLLDENVKIVTLARRRGNREDAPGPGRGVGTGPGAEPVHPASGNPAGHSPGRAGYRLPARGQDG